MTYYENAYAALVYEILAFGEERITRNGLTKAKFAKTLTFNVKNNRFPLLQGRKMHYKGVLGEFAAMIRKPKHLADFEKWGCNYWSKWANKDGSINVDYGNAWFKGGQLDHVRDCLKNNPTDRRMLISGWIPENLADLSLPCCHYSYQFYVEDGKYLNMIWNQRSVDMMIGLPADMILAAIWTIVLANEVDLMPGTITMNLGDCHIYEEHFDNAKVYLEPFHQNTGLKLKPPTYILNADKGAAMTDMRPEWFTFNYHSSEHLAFEVKA